MATDSPSVHDPSKLFFQTDYVRRSIITAYWVIIILALPLWWRTTSIERLSLPSSHVVEQARHNLHIPVRIGLETGSDPAHLQKSIDALIQEAPELWEGLTIEIHEAEMLEEAAVPSSGPILASMGHTLFETVKTLWSMADIWLFQLHRVAQYSPRYRLSFTLLNEDAAAGGSFLDWDISNVIYRHIQPVLIQLNALHNFTIESQVQLHAPLAFTPRSLEHGFGIDPEDLTVFVNSAEWTLSSSASNDPVLHFVIFVPSAVRRPLHILDHKGAPSLSTSFLLPQWGGIVIFNPEGSTQESKLASPNLDAIFSAFSEHLLSLLGVPRLPPNLVKPSRWLTDWQLDALLRYRTLSNSQGSQNTLRSIVSLVDQIENMPVGHDVRGDVQGALVALEEMFEAPKASLVDKFRLSARAFTLSSRAFFNPGMLALLYFPAEHKYAVYTPMFASAVIPLVVAALKEFASWRRERRAKASALGSEEKELDAVAPGQTI
ncbi:hypothetical protein C0991_010507 [Blastosporella zonata]|nr:hypothetical protein C0991_010507 [Blastosporella zonata]